MIPRSVLFPEQVLEIKTLLWEGIIHQAEIAERYNVTQPTISFIFRGHQWPEVAWPNGEVGEIPHERWLTIIKSKRRNAIYARRDRTRDKEPSPIALEAAEIIADTPSPETNASDVRFSDAMAHKTVPKDSKGLREGNPGVYSVTWDEVKEFDPGHRLVQRAERERDTHLQEIITEIFSTVERDKWHSRGTVKAIVDIEKEGKKK